MVVLEDNTICVLFECGRYDYRESIVFARVDLDWLTEEEEPANNLVLFIVIIISIGVAIWITKYIYKWKSKT